MEIEKPLVSIVMPVYNVAEFVAKAIESVLQQDYEHFELLVINDGTPDNSVAIVEEYCKKDARVKLYHKENGGLSDARNYGMQYVTGSYLYFMDSDDWIAPNLLTSTLTTIQKEDSDIVVFGYYKDDEDQEGNLIAQHEVTHVNSVFHKSKAEDLQIDSKLLNLFGYAWNKLYRTDFILKEGFLFPKGVSLVEDILFNSQVLGKTDTIVVLDMPLYHYIHRQRETLIKTYHKNSFELILKKTEAIATFLSAWGLPEKAKQTVLAESVVLGIRYSVNNLFSFDKSLTFKERCYLVKNMLDHKVTRSYVRFYKTSTVMDQLYKGLIKSRASYMLSLLCQIKK